MPTNTVIGAPPAGAGTFDEGITIASAALPPVGVNLLVTRSKVPPASVRSTGDVAVSRNGSRLFDGTACLQRTPAALVQPSAHVLAVVVCPSALHVVSVSPAQASAAPAVQPPGGASSATAASTGGCAIQSLRSSPKSPLTSQNGFAGSAQSELLVQNSGFGRVPQPAPTIKSVRHAPSVGFSIPRVSYRPRGGLREKLPVVRRGQRLPQPRALAHVARGDDLAAEQPVSPARYEIA